MHATKLDWSLLGRGMYTIAEAAALTGLSYAKTRRWMCRLPNREFGDFDEQLVVSFHDLIELRVVCRLIAKRMRFARIRQQHAAMSALFSVTHPFALDSVRLRTDGHDVHFVDDHGTTSVDGFQMVLEQIVEQFLSDVDYGGPEALATRWWLAGRDGPLVCDPRRKFGRPVLTRSGIPVQVVYEAFRSGMTAGDIADWYDIEPASDVAAAIEFETGLRRAS